ncbi:MAG TPA: carboxypeptidase-like regulatory domain-containing protein, partial [Blastocatellia bacterium]|nr:carboxypeptidase-like regulatory domain-containing protein [Blastocatellia bacterium]
MAYAILVAVSITVLSSIAFAQTETGQVTGKVTGSDGKEISGATVTVVSVDTGAERNSTTNDEGIYVVPNLQPGTYEITIKASGFAVEKQQLQITVGSKNQLNAVLNLPVV